MVVLAYITGVVGVLTGLYGAIRAWRTARAVDLLTYRWEASHFDNAAYLVRNVRPRRVYDVTFDLPRGWSQADLEGDPSIVEPNGVLKPLFFRSLGGQGNLVTIHWRQGVLRRRHAQVVALPAAPAIPQPPRVVEATVSRLPPRSARKRTAW